MLKNNMYEIGGKAFPVTGQEAVQGVGIFPVVDLPMVSDYKWQLDCLESRLQHPEQYAEWEDVPATVGRIRAYLEEHKDIGEAEGLYGKYLALLQAQKKTAREVQAA